MASHILEIGKKGNGEERRSVLTFFFLYLTVGPHPGQNNQRVPGEWVAPWIKRVQA